LNTGFEAIRREDERRPFDLFHAFTLLAAFPCVMLPFRRGRPVVASIRGIDGMEFSHPAILKVLRDAAWITSVSSESLARAAAHVDIRDRSSFIANGVLTTYWTEWQPSEQNAGVVGTVSTFRPKKNIPLLVTAYAQLPPALRRRLLLVGDFYSDNGFDFGLRSEVELLAEELGVASEVEITGYIEQSRLPEYHARMAVFVLSSDHEGLPNAMLEAAAAGLPIVASAVDGVKDVFTDRVDALLVEPRDSAALAAAIGEVLTNASLALSLSKAARERAACLSPDAERAEYVKVYDRLLCRSDDRRLPTGVLLRTT